MSRVTRWLARVVMEMAAAGGLVWVLARRRRYRRRGRGLREDERLLLAPHIDEAMLESVRVCEAHRIEGGLPLWLIRALRLPASVDISSASGMAFGDAVVINGAATGRGEKVRRDAILFHELVHCAQYRELGVYRFLRRYLVGWAESGFDYFAIPLEQQAYELQERFEAGERVDVRGEVRRAERL